MAPKSCRASAEVGDGSDACELSPPGYGYFISDANLEKFVNVENFILKNIWVFMK